MTVAAGPGASLEGRITAAADGDNAAFSQLYQEFGSNVYNLVLRSVRNPQAAEDVCQEVWVRAYRRLPELREPAAFTTWLYRIASRACIDRARRPAGRQGAEEELPEQLAASPLDDPEASAIRHERERLLWQALGALPARQHLALFLREVEDKSYQEIASILDTTTSAIETLLFRARRGVAEAFERLQAGAERCGQAKKTMAVLIDGEATAVQRRAVEAHVDECRNCRGELRQLRGASQAYGVLPLLPVPAFLAERVLHGIGTATVSTGGGAIGKVVALFAAKVKLTTAALTVTGGIAVATMAVPGDSLHLDGASASVQSGAAADASPAGAMTPTMAAPSGLVGTTTAAVTDLASLAATLGALQQLSHQMASDLPPPLSQFLQPPAGVLDHLSQLLTPPAIIPELTPPIALQVTPPVALPQVTPSLTLPAVTPPLSLPTATPPLPLPTLALP